MRSIGCSPATIPRRRLEEVRRRAHYRQSVLDGVREDAARLKGRLGRSDQEKLDGYLDSVRSLEKQIEASQGTSRPDVEPPGDSSTLRDARAQAEGDAGAHLQRVHHRSHAGDRVLGGICGRAG